MGDDSHQLSMLGHRQPGDTKLSHDLAGLCDLLLRLHSDGIRDHSALEFFYFFHLRSFGGNGHITVNDSDSALLRHGDGRA